MSLDYSGLKFPKSGAPKGGKGTGVAKPSPKTKKR